MKNFNDIEKLIDLFEKSSLTSMEVKVEGLELKLDKRNFDKPLPPMPIQQIQNQKNNVIDTKVENNTSNEVKNIDNGSYVTSPLVGTFHQGVTQNANALVNVGDKVKKGQKLCMIEAMKVMNEITAPKDGTILEICVKENQMVEYGQNLFKIGD